MNRAIERELRQELKRLAPEQQRQVLDFARALPAPIIPGVSGEVTVRFAGTIPKDGLAIISKAIEKGASGSIRVNGRFLLDTNIVIAIFAAEPAVLQRVATVVDPPVA